MRGDFEKILRQYQLTTAEIFYRLPDHPVILQTYVWQDLDIAPDFPILQRFLNFWEQCLDGKLHSVKVASTALLNPAQVSFCKGIFDIH